MRLSQPDVTGQVPLEKTIKSRRTIRSFAPDRRIASSIRRPKGAAVCRRFRFSGIGLTGDDHRNL